MEPPKKNIIWLASYPKSGNTWMRIFLANYLNNTETPIDINQLSHFPIASSRALFDEATGISSSDLSNEEIDNLRPDVYKYFSFQAQEDIFIKIHDKCKENDFSIIPHENTKSIVYIIRNPLDIAISFARHIDVDTDSAIKKMNNTEFTFCDNTEKLSLQLRQKLSSWSGHVINWTENNKSRLIILRYEDMILKPESTFKKCVDFLNIPYIQSKFTLALKNSDFKNLKKQEKEFGFKERPFKQKSFFWKGKPGIWKKYLSENQIESIIRHHQTVMKKFSYLDENGKPF